MLLHKPTAASGQQICHQGTAQNMQKLFIIYLHIANIYTLPGVSKKYTKLIKRIFLDSTYSYLNFEPRLLESITY